jgi:hypothetical protein
MLPRLFKNCKATEEEEEAEPLLASEKLNSEELLSVNTYRWRTLRELNKEPSDPVKGGKLLV